MLLQLVNFIVHAFEEIKILIHFKTDIFVPYLCVLKDDRVKSQVAQAGHRLHKFEI